MAYDEIVDRSERTMETIELAVALLLVVLFAVGVFDVGRRVFDLVFRGGLTEPYAIVDLLDGVLLLFIVVEVFHTVVAYMEHKREWAVVRVVIFAGIIAMVRKAIVFRTDEYGSAQEALLAAVAYAALLVALSLALAVSYRYSG